MLCSLFFVQWLKVHEGAPAVDRQAAIEKHGLLTVNGTQYKVLDSLATVTDVRHVYLNRLVLRHATSASAGTYVCLAANPYGLVHVATRVTVTMAGGEHDTSSSPSSSSSTNEGWNIFYTRVRSKTSMNQWRLYLNATNIALLVVAFVAFLVLVFLIVQRQSQLWSSASSTFSGSKARIKDDGEANLKPTTTLSSAANERVQLVTHHDSLHCPCRRLLSPLPLPDLSIVSSSTPTTSSPPGYCVDASTQVSLQCLKCELNKSERVDDGVS